MPEQTPPVLRFVPLGGLGEIGMNCFALEQDDGILIVDCGTSFPQNDIGIDVLHPEFSWLVQRRDRVVGLFLTHAHEDHIGAIPYLLRQFDLPIWGPPHALALVKHRLAEHEVSLRQLTLREAVPGGAYQVGPFEVEPVRVAHSIVEATALSIKTCVGTVVHTGDFNLDPDPPDGEPTNQERLRAIGDKGVRLLLSDSTNVDVAERAGSERAVGAALHELIAGAEHRVVIGMFASNIQRLISLGQIARNTDRRICLLGRSLNVQVDVAHRIGRLNWPSDLLVPPEQIHAQRRNKVLVLAGGTQGEGSSALRRLGSATHQHLRLDPGDTVIHSARVIPGNERVVHELFCDLLRQGVVLHTQKSDARIHTSGHAGRSEQIQMIQWLRPQAFVPVHGTLHHLCAHATLAKSVGVAETLVVENGTPVELNFSKLYKGKTVPHGKVSVAYGGVSLDAQTARRRTELGRSGVVAVSAVLATDGKCLYGPELLARGVPNLDQSSPALVALRREVLAVVERFGRMPPARVEDEMRRAVRRFVLDHSGVRPVVLSQLMVGSQSEVTG